LPILDHLLSLFLKLNRKCIKTWGEQEKRV
jgi:hypothetical protein